MCNDENVKTCSKCGKQLPRSEFHKNKQKKDGLRSWCKACYKNDQNPRHRTAYRSSSSNRRYKRLLYSHKRTHPELVHDLTREAFDAGLAVKNCPICGCELIDFVTKHRRSRSFDRFDNDIGLTDQNTWVICMGCNTMKGELSVAELERRICALQKYTNKENRRSYNK